jgi:type VI secretion system protein ImpC
VSRDRQQDTPFRIALLGDFAGRANRGAIETGRALAGRRPVRVDRDDVDEVLARLSPELVLPVGATGEPSAVRFSELDDFHPDRLYDRLPRFRALRDARERASVSAAAGEPGRQSGRASGSRAAAPGAGLLDQILGDVPPPPGAAAAVRSGTEPARMIPADPLTDFIRRAVAPHVVTERAPANPDLVAGVDQTIGAELRAVLHDPDFQAVEAAWRTVDFLVHRLETDDTLQIYLVDVAKPELAGDLAGNIDPASSGSYRLFLESSTGPGAAPWTVLVGLYNFGARADDIGLLERLAALARAVGAPFVAGADPQLVGCPSFGSAPDPDDWSRADLPEWEALRRSENAPYVGLAAPRFILRLPYGGRDGDPCEVPQFEELSSPAAHEEYLWGNSAALCALLLGEAFTADRWALRPGLDVPGLPLHLIRAGGEITSKPCAEAVLSARAVERIVEHGVMAVQSQKDGDAVRLYRFQSVANPLTALPLRFGPADANR